MEKSFQKMLTGYQLFRKKYAVGDTSTMQHLSQYGQHPEFMAVACCDSRVDPAVVLQCEPGEIFTMRNIANIIPPYEKDSARHDTCAALEYGVRVLNIKHLIILGHSQCGGITATLQNNHAHANDFIANWISLLQPTPEGITDVDTYAKMALQKSLERCMTFPWIRESIERKTLAIHLWFFDIKQGLILTYNQDTQSFMPFGT